MCLVGDKEMTTDNKYIDDDTGMLGFLFPDGHRWVSSLPALGNMCEKQAEVMLSKRLPKSKAAPNVVKRPAGSSKKLVYSKAYHKALSVLKKDPSCDLTLAKASARSAAKQAVLDMDGM